MRKSDLLELVGKKVKVILFDGTILNGELNYVDEFSSKHDYRKTDYFYIENSNIIFRVSHIKKLLFKENIQ